MIKPILGLFLALFLAFVAYALYYHMAPVMTVPQQFKTATVAIGSTTVAVQVADTPATRTQGLSGRETICGASLRQGCGGAQQGMLFVFEAPGHWGFWMKDMNFPIDMLFANASGRIVTVEQNLSPASYNAQDPQASKIYYPAAPAKYVLEVPAGFAAAHGIAVGSKLVVQ